MRSRGPHNFPLPARTRPAARNPDREYRERLADRLREVRAACGMTRAALASDSGVSLRLLVQLEAASGNPSLTVMRRVASALGIALESLIAEAPPANVDRLLVERTLNQMTPDQLATVRALLTERFAASGTVTRSR